MAKVQQQLKILTDSFEDLASQVLKSQSPKSYSEFFTFFRSYLNPEQVFFWIDRKNAKKGKQKFLSLQKTDLSSFGVMKEQFLNCNFNDMGCVIESTFFALKLPTGRDGEFFCFYFFKSENEDYKNEVVQYIFCQRLLGLLKLVDRVSEIQSLNFIDDVTGLYNQRYLNILLDQEIERFKRTNVSFSVLFIDVDHFKVVNDKNGHLVGSQILKEIGGILKGCVRAVDFCFRYGGDEFLLVLTNTSTEQAMTVANRVCAGVATTPFVVGGKPIHITLSIGVACFPDHAQTKEKILQVADEAMYCGKNSTRNIVYLAS